MKDIALKYLDPNDLEIDPVNERVTNVGPHTDGGESLQKSIEQQGVIEPVVVRKVDGQYYVIAGQRRTLAAQAAGENSIPARVVDIDDAEARMVSIAENATQFSKEVPPADRAVSIKELLDSGYTISDIAERMGVSEPTVHRWVEPARRYWEDTLFEAEPENNGSDLGPDDISLQAMKIIRQNTTEKEQRERIAKKVVKENVKNNLVREAASRSDTPNEFEGEIDRIIKELEADISIIREEVHISGVAAKKMEEVMKNRGINEKEAAEMLIKQRLSQLQAEENGKWVGIKLDEEIANAMDEVIGDRDLKPKDLMYAIIKRQLEDWGYLDST